MDHLIADIRHQLNEQSAKIANLKNAVELSEKEKSQAEELLMDQLEVGPKIDFPNGVPPTVPTEPHGNTVDVWGMSGHLLRPGGCIPLSVWLKILMISSYKWKQKHTNVTKVKSVLLITSPRVSFSFSYCTNS